MSLVKSQVILSQLAENSKSPFWSTVGGQEALLGVAMVTLQHGKLNKWLLSAFCSSEGKRVSEGLTCALNAWFPRNVHSSSHLSWLEINTWLHLILTMCPVCGQAEIPYEVGLCSNFHK